MIKSNMNKLGINFRILTALCLVAGLSAMSVVNALSLVDQRHINMLTQGGIHSVKQASEEMYHAQETNTEILDILAEVLLNKYQGAQRGDIDGLAWATKALGRSGNARYRNVLTEVIEKNSNKKLTKYAKQSLKQLPKGKVAQYKRGKVDLGKEKAKSAKAAASAPVAKRSKGKYKFDIVTVGMSMQEVYDLIGHPTATTSHITGKAFVPFNFKGSDTMRTIALYKGQGRIIFSNNSHYTMGGKVLEIQVNPHETGYP